MACQSIFEKNNAIEQSSVYVNKDTNINIWVDNCVNNDFIVMIFLKPF